MENEQTTTEQEVIKVIDAGYWRESLEEVSMLLEKEDIDFLNGMAVGLRKRHEPTKELEIQEREGADDDEECLDGSCRKLPYAMMRSWLLADLARMTAFILGCELIRCESDLPDNSIGQDLHREIGDVLCKESSDEPKIEFLRGITVVLNEMTI